MWRCAKCGAEVAYGDSFCRKCGTAFGLVEASAAKSPSTGWKCSACGGPVSRADRRCPSCRVRLEFEDDSTERFLCSDCGTRVTRSNRICPGCGVRLDFDDGPPTPPARSVTQNGGDGWRIASLVLVGLSALMAVAYFPQQNDYWPEAVLFSAALQPLAWFGVACAYVAQRRGIRGAVGVALLIWGGGALVGAIVAAAHSV